MKKYIILVVVAVSLGAPVLVFGRTPTEMQETMQNRRAEVKQTIQELHTKLAAIRDEKKKQAVERIQTNLTALNDRMVEHFNNVLDRLGNILGRIAKRANGANQNGTDVSSVLSAIDAASAAIATAKSAAEIQADKAYNVEITDETHLRANVGKARQSLHTDLKRLFGLVKAAREAVSNAAVSLGQIPHVDDDLNHSTSTQP